MARLEYITLKEAPIEEMLTDFKRYASIPDDSQDDMLLRILRNATLRVQESADRAYLEAEVRQNVQVPPTTGVVRLYLGGGAVSAVVNDNGDQVPYHLLPGGRLQFNPDTGAVSVTFNTQPTEGDRALLSQSIIRYATADYDGAETAELNRILTEAVL